MVGIAPAMTIYRSDIPHEQRMNLFACSKRSGLACWWTFGRCRGRERIRSLRAKRCGKCSESGTLSMSIWPSWAALRHATKDSLNDGWRNDSFRGYADYMQTAEFARAIEQLMEIAGKRRTAIMCAEAVPWRCHRLLVGDALLLVRGVEVLDIMSEKNSKPHKLTAWARVQRTTVTYPKGEDRATT